MDVGVAVPGPGEVMHFSEDPTIAVFAPHVAPTAEGATPYVWAVDAARAPDYWFPRQCPRAMAWVVDGSTPRDCAEMLGPSARRVHVIEFGSLATMIAARLVAYRLPAETFVPHGEPVPHAMVSTVVVEPLGPPEPVGDLLALHAAAGIELRLVADLRQFVERAAHSTLGFSGIRLHLARHRDPAWSRSER